jgi:hypothetical protein
MSTQLEVFFCDLCNESVPQTDIASGKAIRIKGRVVGACCTGAFTRAGEAAAAKPRSAGASGAVALGVIVLAGVAAAAAFLDWRLANEVGAISSRLGAVEDGLRAGQERLPRVEEAVTLLGARLDPAAVIARVEAVDVRVEEARKGSDQRVAALDAALQSVKAAQQAAQAEQRETLASLGTAVQSLTGEVAALRAIPHAAPKPVEAEAAASQPEAAPPTPARVPDMPPELQHQVLALGDEDPGTRFSAVDKLLRSHDLRVLPNLLPMAKDANTFVRRLTVEGLRDFRRPEVVDALLVALADPEPIVRLTASASLRALTAQRIDFDDSSVTTRTSGQRRWQEWWDKNRATFTF